MCVRLHDNCGGLCNVRCAAANKKTPLWTDVTRLQLHYTPVVLLIFISCSRNASHSRLGAVYSAAPLTDYFILFMGWIFLNLTLLHYPVYVELIKTGELGEELSSMKEQVRRRKQSQLIDQTGDMLTWRPSDPEEDWSAFHCLNCPTEKVHITGSTGTGSYWESQILHICTTQVKMSCEAMIINKGVMNTKFKHHQIWLK